MVHSDKNIQPQRLRRILFAFGLSSRGESLLRIAHAISPEAGLQALHFLHETGLSAEEISFRMAESFESVRALTDQLSANTMFVYRQTRDITLSIVEQARSFRAEVLLVGAALGSTKDPLGGRVAQLIERSPCPIGISTGHLQATERITIICDPGGDLLCLDLFSRARAPGGIRVHSSGEPDPALQEKYSHLDFFQSEQALPAPGSCDLLVMDAHSWDRFPVPAEQPALIVVPPVIL